MTPTKEDLERLYISEKLTSRDIGCMFGTSKTVVLRWLRELGIPPRASGRGLNHRGKERPSKETLELLIHHNHYSYREIAAMSEVDQSAVAYWVKTYGIKPPKTWDTRRNGVHPIAPTKKELHRLYTLDNTPLDEIAESFCISRGTLIQYFQKFSIEVKGAGFAGKRFICDDGHVVMSSYELRVDNWLHQNGIDHIYEPSVPFHNLCKADFLAQGCYVEIWGIGNSAKYTQRKNWKKEMYIAHGLPLLEIGWYAFAASTNELWKRKLSAKFLL